MNAKRTLFLNAPLNLAAASEGGLPSTFQGDAYTGAVVEEYGYRFIVDLSQTAVEPKHALLHEHQRSAVIGLVTQSTNNGQQITVSGDLYSDVDAAAKDIAIKSQKGFPYQMSIGLYGVKEVARIKDGETLSINGRQVVGPITVLRGGTVRETSVVTLGADSATNAAFFAAHDAEDSQSLTNTVGDNNMTEEQLTARVTELTALVTQLTARAEAAEAQATAELARADELQAELATLRTEQRRAEVVAALTAAGEPTTDSDVVPYLSMAQEQWTAVKTLLSRHGGTRDHLFTEQATGGDSSGVVIDAGAIYAARRVAK